MLPRRKSIFVCLLHLSLAKFLVERFHGYRGAKSSDLKTIVLDSLPNASFDGLPTLGGVICLEYQRCYISVVYFLFSGTTLKLLILVDVSRNSIAPYRTIVSEMRLNNTCVKRFKLSFVPLSETSQERVPENI